ncbi:unnamed protein product [Macrosiphum euphorbiae]|uniref:Uncharacterized protein n=1 Tax=Macrosiphum euphorbiae TaxID=13131 RepID=A0AAV0W0Q3_9HEMI|nr:unnamed protein product [Macrosiphum euphorbiae]
MDSVLKSKYCNITNETIMAYLNLCTHFNQRQENIKNKRNNSIQCLKKQAERMMTQSNKKYQELEVGTTVRISIPDVNRARGSPRNLLTVIANVDNGFYKLCTENGFLKHNSMSCENKQ